MYGTSRVINNLTKLTRNYTRDLAQPFADNIEANAEAETPILVIADVCKRIGLSAEQTERVLGCDGVEFVQFITASARYLPAVRKEEV